jgi:hypothetical protein
MKTNRKFAARSRHLALFMLALALLPVAPFGCIAAPELTISSINGNQTYKQGFTHAYTRRNNNGEVDVVLIDDAAKQALDTGATTAPVRQVLHIRILWSPTRDMKAVVSNAAVKWYVIGSAQPQDLLQYSGIAFVSMQEDEDSVTLKVQNATLKPTGAHGNLTDPVGQSRLEGTFVAYQNDEAVTKVLNGLKASVAAANAPSRVVTSTPQDKAIDR